jgi:hypothetical protein
MQELREHCLAVARVALGQNALRRWYCICQVTSVRLLTFHPRANTAHPRANSAPASGVPRRVPGAYVGHVRYRPRHPSRIPDLLYPAIGQVVEVACAGVAPSDDKFAGQALYMEWRRDDVFGGYLIPEQDLEFPA